ncbi:MAG: hypothetical protein FWE10_01565 [Rikenellaceae bacterium]|nr:hypothetical protein [Rikenellaceae bacterium]MCL2692577.1 hypothetical protein [Rikenellaceae bacterium]
MNPIPKSGYYAGTWQIIRLKNNTVTKTFETMDYLVEFSNDGNIISLQSLTNVETEQYAVKLELKRVAPYNE